jgi:hypothetical protein
MALPQKFYLNHIQRNTEYRANWLPDRPLKIGDIGKLEDGLFTLYTTLEQQNIKVRTRQSESSLNLDYTSNNSVNIEIDVATSNTGNSSINSVINGKVLITFNESNGVVFQMTGIKKEIIENLAEIEPEILEKYRRNEWPKEWVIINELIITDRATIIISTSNNNRIELGCSAPLEFAKNKLADPKINLTLLSERGSSTKIFGMKGLTPLYRVRGIAEPFLRKPEFRSRGALDDNEEIRLKDLSFDQREL